MCGLVGIAGKLEFKDEMTLKRLLLLDYFRGMDSTGVASIRKDGEIRIAKISSHPIDLFDTKRYELVNHGYQSLAFIGHNRAATRGKVNENNAHPYQYGHIIGAHNGTLDTTSWADLNKALGYETDVDSMAIFACIEKIGIEETVKLLSGAWALVWYDLKEGTLNFLRNKERPFWFAYNDEFDRVFWASEWPMIQAAVELAPASSGYTLYQDKQNYSYFPTDENYLYQYDLKAMMERKYKSVPPARGKKLEGKAPAPVVTTYRQQGGSPFTAGSGTTTNLKDGATPTKQDLPVFITIVTGEDKPLAGFMNQEEFNELSRGKCCYCHEPVNFFDEGIVVFEGMDEALCAECSGHTTTRFLATPKTYLNHLNPKENVA